MNETPDTRTVVPCNPGILLADDEVAITNLFQRILRKEFSDREIMVAADGNECLEVFSEHHQKLILLDLHMPILDGINTFHKISDLCMARHWETPSIIFFTGFAPSEKITEIIKTDPRHDILQKPVSLDALLKAVKDRIR